MHLLKYKCSIKACKFFIEKPLTSIANPGKKSMVMVCLHKDHWKTLKAIALWKKNYLPIVNGWFGSPTFHDLVQFLLVPQSLVVPLLSHCDLEAVLLHNYNNLSIGSIHPSKAFEFIQIYKYQNSFNLCFYAVEQFNFLDWTASFLLEGKSDQNFVVLHLLSPPSPFGNGPSPLIHLLYPRQIGAKAGRRLW